MRSESGLRLGYSSLGLASVPADISWSEVLDVVIDEAGFELVELHPQRFDADARTQLRDRARAVRARGGEVLLGLGARELLSDRKHEPSLSCADDDGRARRVALLREALELARELGAAQLIFLSGPNPELCHAGPDKYAHPAWRRLCDGLEQLLPIAAQAQVVLALEAHCQHLVASVADIAELQQQLESPWLGFTADTVHQHIVEQQPAFELYRRAAPRISHVQLDNSDNAPGQRDVVSHRLLDEPGRVDLVAGIDGLIAGGYRGCLSVEFLSADAWAAGIDALAYCRRIGPWLRALIDARRAVARTNHPEEREQA